MAKKMSQAVNDARVLAESIIETINESLLILDKKLCVIAVNRAFLRTFHVTHKEIKGKVIYDLGDGQWDIGALRRLLEKIIPRNGKFDNFEVKHTFPRIGTRIMLLSGRRINQGGGRRKLILLAMEDITERKGAEEHMRYMSFHDSLTGLYNRAYFEEELRRTDTGRKLPISIIVGDINNLKNANDTYGHSEGDKLLKKMAEIIQSCCRSSDVVARWGGDEFIIILPGTNNITAGRIMKQIKMRCAHSKGIAIQPNIALGSATKNRSDKRIEFTVKEAEDKMYEDKLQRNKVKRKTAFNPDMFIKSG
ncbi:MAG: diguanylate cyclase [Endomicrobiales bacterium]|nr:diguanylate cyclase [Endomicrobiales bacterium]